MNRKKLCYIISGVDKAVAFEWIAREFKYSDIELSFILIGSDGTSHLGNHLKNNGIKVKEIRFNSKSYWLLALFSCSRYLMEWRPDIVHCHLRHATMIGLLSAKLLGIKKRIYTRHHSTFHHDYFPKAVKWDQLANTLATEVVAISRNVEKVLVEKEKVPPAKVKLIHHGFDLDAFGNVSEERKEQLRNKYLPRNFKGKVLGVIGRYIEWKGHQYIIHAAREILAKYPDTFFVFANASGPDEPKIKDLLKNNLPFGKYVEVKFEEDLFALYRLFDAYLHVPVNENIEAFGQTYVEALAAGIPSIFTLSGVAKEFIEDDKNALVVPFKNSAAIVNAFEKLNNQPELKERLISNGKKSVEIFNLRTFVEKLEKLYLKT